MNCGRAAARLEKRGIPTVTVVRNEFIDVLQNGFAGFGFAPELAMVVLPIDVFLVESDLTPIEEKLNDFTEKLTKWEPKMKGKVALKPPKVMIEGKGYEELIDKMNTLFLRNMWGDGLPILPPTKERVSWMLTGTDLSPDIEIGVILPQGRIATVETLAVSLAMAGGRPEYMPVLIAAIKALLKPGMLASRWQTTSCSIYPAVIVNGPVARQIRLNSGFGLLGPDPQNPAGASIGRAIRLILQNVGGAIPGVGTMAMYGGMRYTNAVFAEDEEGLPPAWEPINVEYFGYPKGTNTVAIFSVNSATNIHRRARAGWGTLVDEARESLYKIAAYMGSPNQNILDPYHGPPGVLILSSVVANQLVDVGWSKEKIKEFLWDNSKISLANLEKTGLMGYVQRHHLEETLQDPWPMTSKPQNLVIVIAGGHHPTHAYWMQGGGHGAMPQIMEMQLPVHWDSLIKDAEEDLGPTPLRHQVNMPTNTLNCPIS